jgi:hypothetical protein
MLIVAFGAVLRSGKGAIVRCIPIARRSEIFWCDSGVLQFPDVVLCNRRSHAQAGQSGFDPFFTGSTRECQRPASCGKVLEQSASGLPYQADGHCGRRSSAASPLAACGAGRLIRLNTKAPPGALPGVCMVATCETWRNERSRAESSEVVSTFACLRFGRSAVHVRRLPADPQPIASKSSLARGRGILIEPRDALDEVSHPGGRPRSAPRERGDIAGGARGGQGSRRLESAGPQFGQDRR